MCSGGGYIASGRRYKCQRCALRMNQRKKEQSWERSQTLLLRSHLHTGPAPRTRPTNYPYSHPRRRHPGRDGLTTGVQVHPRDISDGEPLRKPGPPPPRWFLSGPRLASVSDVRLWRSPGSHDGDREPCRGYRPRSNHRTSTYLILYLVLS